MKQNISLIAVALITLSFIQSNAGWKEFKPLHGGCSVEMPGVPQVRTDKKNKDNPKDVRQMVFFLEPPKGTDDNLVYGLSYTLFPAGTIHKDSLGIIGFFNQLKDEMLDNLHAKLLSEKEFKYNSYPGREYKVSIKNGTALILFRNYLIQDKYYTLQVCTAIGNDNNIALTKYFDSFKILEK